jgi:Putative zinc-finger
MNFGMRHLPQSELALYAGGDLSPWRRTIVRAHLTSCAGCRGWVTAYRTDRESLRPLATAMPAGVNWDRLAVEMSANIRVGLEAGECVTPRIRKPALATGWRVAAVAAGIIVLLVSAWWLNMPRAESIALGRVVQKIAQARPWKGGILALEDRGPLLEISAAGIQLQQNGGTLGMSQGKERPVTVTLSVQGSARARYIDADTGQVTITGVYAQ